MHSANMKTKNEVHLRFTRPTFLEMRVFTRWNSGKRIVYYH